MLSCGLSLSFFPRGCRPCLPAVAAFLLLSWWSWYSGILMSLLLRLLLVPRMLLQHNRKQSTPPQTAYISQITVIEFHTSGPRPSSS